MPNVNVARVGPEDWPLVLELRLAMFAESPTAFGDPGATSRALDQERWRERYAVSPAWHALVGTAPVASTAVTPVVAREATAELHSVWVAPTYRGRGIARQLLNVAIDYWRSQSGHLLHLWVDDVNSRAKRCIRLRTSNPRESRGRAALGSRSSWCGPSV